MFHADNAPAELIAHVLVAVLFIGAGLFNAGSRERTRQHVAHFATLGLPAPALVLHTGYAMQFAGGLMVLVDWYAAVGALVLIVFTLVAMFTHHYFWLMDDPVRRNTARLFFLNNCGVLGGLSLLASPAFAGF